MSSATAHEDKPGHGHDHRQDRKGDAALWAGGGTMFAGVLMLVNGILGVFAGIAGIAKDDVYERIGDYVYKFNLTAWGWIHLILGLVIAVTGWGVLKGAGWARATGVALAALGIVAQFLWLPYTPVWALISIAIGVFVIWALCTDSADRARV
ncbi:Integral membrane protein OS=Streptomyces alboniger OX=132473 GN=CP975_18285 PE=4 SV=1 [Streptomyces alboniger]